MTETDTTVKIETGVEDIEDQLNMHGHAGKANDSEEEDFAGEGDEGKNLGDFEKLSREFTQTVLRQVQDVATSAEQREPFVELLSQQITQIARLSKTTQSLQGHMNSLLKPYVQEIEYKAGFIADAIANEVTATQEQVTSEDVQKVANATKRDLMTQICSTYGQALKEAQVGSFSPTAANLLIQLGVELHTYGGSKQKAIAPSTLSIQQMCKVGHHLLERKNSQKTQILDKLATKVFQSLLTKTADPFDFESLKALKSRFALTILGQHYQQSEGQTSVANSSLLDHLADKSNSLAFDDKNRDALQNVHYLKFFYKQLNESALLEKVLPEAQFASKKDDRMIRNVALLAKNLSIELSYEAAVQIVKETLSADMFVTEANSVSLLLSSVCQKVRTEDWEKFENELFRKTIWGLYDQIRGDLAAPHANKMLAINSIFACLSSRQQKFSSENTQKTFEEFIDLLLSSKDEVNIPQYVTSVFENSVKDFPEITKMIGEKSQKLLSGTQISFVEKLCKHFTSEVKQEIVDSCARTLTTVNLQSATAFNVNLALISTINTCGGLKQLFADNPQIVKFLCSPASVINNESFWAKNPSKSDIGHHLTLLGELSKNREVLETSAGQWKTLIQTYINYVTAGSYIYRDSEISRLSNIFAKDLSAPQLTQILEALFVKQTHILEQNDAKVPQKAAATQEYDGRQKEASMLVSRRISKAILILLEGFTKTTETSTIDYNLLSLILQCLAHDIASPSNKSMKKSFRKLQKLFGEEKLSDIFQEHNAQLIDQFMKSRTGLLCPVPKVRNIAQKILTCVGWAGFLEQILANVEPLINYKPIQMLDKFEQLLNQEFETISHYDLMAYSDLSKGLVKMYDSSDEDLIKKALRLDSVNQIQEEEEKKEDLEPVAAEPVIQADLEKPIDLAAALKLKMKSKKTAKGSKKGKKGKSSSTAGKPASSAPVSSSQASTSAASSSSTVMRPKQIEEENEENLGKEEKNRRDRKQMLRFVDLMRTEKATQVSSILDILKNSCDCPLANRLNYQDKTLNVTLNSIIKLLSLPSTRFATQKFFSTVLGQSQSSPFFKIKSAILTCFLAIAKDRLTHSITQEFQNCLVFLDESTEFSDIEGGYLQLTLTIANYVLKDPSVNLSVKEIGLMVTQSILESNNSVQIVDIVRLTINMLKTNYISKNLSLFLRKLLQRCSKIEIAMLMQRIFDYQPVPRQTFLQEIYAYDEALFSPVWLQTQLWMLLFDDELTMLARKIWNRFGLYLRTEVISLAHENSDRNLFHYMRSQNTSVFNFTIQASASAIEMLQYVDQTGIIADLEAFYDSEWVQIELLSVQACEDDIDKDQAVQKEIIADERTNRIAVPQILNKICALIQVKDFELVLAFLVTKACLDQNSEVQEASTQAAVNLIKAQGPHNANQLLVILEKFLTSTEGPEATIEAKNQACILLASLAPFLADTSAKKVAATFEHLVTLCHESQSEMLRKSISKCIPQLSRYFPDKAKLFLNQQLVLIRESKDERSLKGVAYVAAGLFKQRGLKAFTESRIIALLGKENFVAKKSDSVRKIASLNLFECLAFCLGRSFELFLDQVFPHILGSISDQREVVREAAISALQVIMSNFTNYAIKQALPQFLEQLETDNWRSKISTVEALGNMAYCAPKQISSFLPQIVKGLREVMNDTHEKVHESAIQAISKIGSVIKCPEVGDMLQIIIRALSNTSKYLNECLHLLLETSFVHAIDAPSLSLLVPLLDSGLMMYDNKAKQMASQLMGNICSLTKDASDLLPYMTILMPATKNALFDAIPEIRASAAKAMGSLSKGLGIENSMEMLGWLREHLHTPGIAAAEKLGAAQGFAELISVHGDEYFDMNVQEVVIKAKDKNNEIRESYRTVLIFLPNSYGKFVDKLQSLMPLLIEGLADDLDEVRKVSMRTIKICIKKFGKQAPNQLVMPIMRMMFSVDYRVRQSSSILMYQLVKELENDIIKAQPKYVDMDTKYRILSSMFILKYDQIERVHTQAGQIWKNIVDNQLIVLRQIIDTLIQLVFQIIQSSSIELQEMGLACMRGLVEKFGEKLVNRALDIFERFLDTATESSQQIGICKVMYNMVSASSFRLLQMISPRMISILEDNLASEDEDIRNWSANVFITMFQRQPDKHFIDPTMDKCILYKLKMFVREERHDDASRLIISLKYLIFRAPELRLQDRLLQLCEITKRDQPFSIAQALVLKALAPTIAPKVFHTRLYTSVLNSLEEELTCEKIDDESRIEAVMTAYAELIACIPTIDIKMTEEVLYRFFGSCSELKRPAFYLDLISNYCANSVSEIEPNAHIYLENCLMYMNHPDEKVIAKLIKAIDAIFARVSKETQFTLIPILRDSIEGQCVDFLGGGSKLLGYPTEHRYRKKVESLALLKTAAGQKALVEVIQAAIMHGNVQVRIDSAFCFKYLLDFAPALDKKEIIKICGALIRVANDKFSQELKLQIFYALRFIQIKGAVAAKGFQIQLQTTFLKALGDPQSSYAARRVVIENLVLLIKGVVRVDPIVKELNSLIEGIKIDGEQKMCVSECLALVIRAKGKAITSAQSANIYKTLTEILGDQSKGAINDKVLTNCATALGFLSAYSNDANQMIQLFDAFDEEANDAICLPLKFAILANGNEKVDKTPLAERLYSELKERLVDGAGFEEIDDDPAPLGEDEGCFRFKGVLELSGHILDKFARRDWCQSPDSIYTRGVLNTISKSCIFEKIQEESDISADSYILINKFLASIPVKCVDLGGKFSDELEMIIAQALNVVRKFYLDHESLNEHTCDSLLNIFGLNYDNYLELTGENAFILTKPMLKEVLKTKTCLQGGFVSDDMKLYAVDILFKKK